MARSLSGSELASFIKERQAHQVRNLRQQYKVIPKLLIIQSAESSDVINTYVRMKARYAEDILIDVAVAAIAQQDIAAKIAEANTDSAVHGIIIQLPLDDPSETETLCNQIAVDKDVDGLGENGSYVSATAEAIDWLLAGYNVDLKGKRLAVLGHGKLVGKPLAKLWQSRGLDVTVLDENSKNTDKILSRSDVIVAATGVPGVLRSAQVAKKAVVVDAGTASENGVIVGDAAPDLRERSDVTITPQKGGVGPLTIAVLFDHVIQSATKIAR